MKMRLTIGIILVLGMSLFFSSMIFCGPNENAGIVFDLDATTYGNQNLISIASQPAGTFIRVDVYAIEVHNLDTYTFEVIYDPDELDYVTSSATNPLTFEPNILTKNGGTAIGWMVDNSTPGVLSLAYTLAGVDTLEAPEGEGLIADIVFQPIVPTHGTLSFEYVHFYDSFGVMDIISDKGIAKLYQFGNIDGTVTNSNTGLPIENAIVSTGDFSDTTGTYGTYLLEYVPLGIHDITCTAEEYYDTVDVVNVLEGQTVTKDFVLVPFPRGMLDGTVTDANNAEPIENALITATSQGKVQYTGFTNANGYYIIDGLLASEIVGNYIVICDAGVPYTSGEVTDVEIIEDNTATVDFVLPAPIMVVDPTSINETVIHPDDTPTTYITVSNTGSAPLEWSVDMQFPDRQVINIPPATNDFPRSEDKLSLSLAPRNGEPTNSSTTPMINPLRGTTAYAFNVYPGSDFVIFDTDAPETWLTTIPMSYKPYAADFYIDDNFYAIDYFESNLYAVDIETGAFTLIGPTQASTTDLACDKNDGTMYAASYYGSNSYLYTIDLITGSATLIGLINAGGLIISMACDCEGNLWGFNILDDALYAIDKDDGHGTYVGLVGFNGNYAQSMAWDPESDIVYMAALNGTAGNVGQLRIVDTSTGATALVGCFNGDAEVTGLGFQGRSWIRLSEYSGIVLPGEQSTVQATVYWLEEFFPGQVKYADIVFTPDPNCGEQTVDVTATFGASIRGSISGSVTLENTPYISGNVEDVLLTAVSQVFPNSYYTAYPDSTGEYTIQGVYPDTYDVTATLENYEDATIEGVVVLENQNTPNIDFELNCLPGALQGTVTDGWGVPIEGAVVTATSVVDVEYQDTTNSDGYYIIPAIQEGTYNVSCFAEGYNIPATQTVIVVDETTTVNFSLTQPTMDITPTSIFETVSPSTPIEVGIHIVNNGDGELAWDASIIEPDRGVETDYSNCTTGILEAKNGQANSGGYGSNGFVAEENLKDDVTLHYDGPNADGIGLRDGGTFMVAARFTPTELGDFYGDYQLSNVEIFIYDMPTSATLKVWEGGSMGDPGTEIYSEDITNQISQQSWATIILSAPITLVSDNEYWIGYEVTHNADLLPAGCDAGPAVDEKGDWVYLAPGPWEEMKNVSQFNVNWNIRAVLSPAWITLTHNSGRVEAGGDSTVTVYFNTIDHTIGEILQATIDFVSTPDVGITSIPVIVIVDSVVGVSGEPEVIVTELYGNFPNPFSSSTTIKFSLKEATCVKLSIYNIRGQLVNRLIDQDMVAGADYQVKWDGASNDKKLANGIYFYKLETGNKTFLKKMILMK